MRRVERGVLGTVVSLIVLAFVVPAVGQSDGAAKASAGKSTGGADHNVPRCAASTKKSARSGKTTSCVPRRRQPTANGAAAFISMCSAAFPRSPSSANS